MKSFLAFFCFSLSALFALSPSLTLSLAFTCLNRNSTLLFLLPFPSTPWGTSRAAIRCDLMFIVISLCARSRGDAAARKESKRRIDGENSRSAEPPPSSRRRSVGIRSLASASLRRLLLPLSPPQHVCTYQVSRCEALKKQKTTLSLLLKPHTQNRHSSTSQQDARSRSRAQAQVAPPLAALGRQGLQEVAPRLRVEEAVRRGIARQGHRAREDVSEGSRWRRKETGGGGRRGEKKAIGGLAPPLSLAFFNQREERESKGPRPLPPPRALAPRCLRLTPCSSSTSSRPPRHSLATQNQTPNHDTKQKQRH
jgi:hypothetical protein